MTDYEIARHVARMYPPAHGLTYDDYVSIAWLAAWRARRTYRPDRGMGERSWRYAQARWAVLHAMRDASGVPGSAYEKGVRFDAISAEEFDDAEKWGDIADTRLGPEAQALSAAGVRRIWSAVDTLPPAQRAAVECRVQTGKACRSLQYARKRLRQVLEGV